MMAMKFFVNRVRCDQLRGCYVSLMYQQMQQQGVLMHPRRFFVSKRLIAKVEPAPTETTVGDDGHYWPRKIFSGIQPTGDLHLGNYLGAVRKWTKLQDAREDVTFCIVDMHSITIPQDPAVLREQIFKMAATMLACGIDPNQSTLFVQSAVKEHSELCWLLGTLSTMARLGHLPQYKEKTRQMKEIPLGLFVYPVLQAADILLYKTTHVPVGEDQLQHIQLTQHLAKNFNTRFGRTFPICHAMIDNKQVSRIRSLRDPTKKMSKSDPDPKSAIYVTDDPEWIVEKVKKAVTDFCSDVSYEPETRLGVSNLIAMHSHMSGQPIEKIVDEARTMDTGKYKLRVAEAIVEHLKPIRDKIQKYTDDRTELIQILDSGAEKARHIACETIEEVKQKMGLGAPYLPMFMDLKRGSSGSGNGSGNANNNTSNSGTAAGAAGLGGEGGDSEQLPQQVPRQNMSAVAMATAAVNAQTGGSTAAPQINQMIMGFGRPALTMAFKQVQNVNCQPAISNDHTVEPAPPKPNTPQRPIVPQQKVRIEKKTPTRISSASSKAAQPVSQSITENLLSLSLLQKRSSPPPPPQSPLQALLPQYQQQVQEHLELQQQQQQQQVAAAVPQKQQTEQLESQQQQPTQAAQHDNQQQTQSQSQSQQQASQQQQQQQQQPQTAAQDRKERVARGRSSPTFASCTDGSASISINDRGFMATSALAVTKPLPAANLELTPVVKAKKLSTKQASSQASSALSENVPATVPSERTNEAKSSAANGEPNDSHLQLKTTIFLEALKSQLALDAATNKPTLKQQQLATKTTTRSLATLSSSQLTNIHSTNSAFSSTSSSTSSTSSFSFSSSPDSSNNNSKSSSSTQVLVKLTVFGLLAIGAGFSGVYYFWTKVFKTYFGMKKNGGD